ncbi:hypothetical protein M011DRAFT_504264 [Sporormia fimetaria CBS 119925]|uniref:Uncharacterized protein n=1 Tax=Sporormia fimetaria CBS 119925 TaxID=1340428 RepID=A0A6A6V9H5_9PLEO|nr:hypothetical protein M011DRAFT_504264 [Sporormia fimetaria CBS 119925]
MLAGVRVNSGRRGESGGLANESEQCRLWRRATCAGGGRGCDHRGPRAMQVCYGGCAPMLESTQMAFIVEQTCLVSRQKCDGVSSLKPKGTFSDVSTLPRGYSYLAPLQVRVLPSDAYQRDIPLAAQTNMSHSNSSAALPHGVHRSATPDPASAASLINNSPLRVNSVFRLEVGDMACPRQPAHSPPCTHPTPPSRLPKARTRRKCRRETMFDPSRSRHHIRVVRDSWTSKEGQH